MGVEDLFTNLINNAVALKLKRRNFKLLSKRQKQPWNKKRIRFLGPPLSLDKFAKKSTGRSMRRKKSLTTPAKITNAPWILCKPHWKQISMSSKLHWITLTRLMLKLTSPSSVIKVNLGIPRDSWNQRLAKNSRSPRRLDWLTARLMHCKAN